MRRLLLVCLTVFLAAGIALSVTFSVNAQTASQYAHSQGDAPEMTTASEKMSAPAEPVPVSQAPKAALLPTGNPSQGSVVEGPDFPEENFPAYSQVVDNDSKGRFKASGWRTESSGSYFYGENYGVADRGKGTKPAQYKVKIPATDKYTVYAWWPAKKENRSATRYGVRTTSGVRWTEVDQQRDGGLWVKLGEYDMAKGDRYAVQVAPGSEDGFAVADGVAVVRGALSGPPADGNANNLSVATRAGGGGSGYAVVQEARGYMNTPYKYATCTKSAMSCTCLTKVAVAPFGHRLTMIEAEQWRYDGSVFVRYAKLQPGDEVFFKEGGSRSITHVGIYSGNGNIVHASSYFGRVVEKPMKYIDGYAGAKRFQFR